MKSRIVKAAIAIVFILTRTSTGCFAQFQETKQHLASELNYDQEAISVTFESMDNVKAMIQSEGEMSAKVYINKNYTTINDPVQVDLYDNPDGKYLIKLDFNGEQIIKKLLIKRQR